MFLKAANCFEAKMHCQKKSTTPYSKLILKGTVSPEMCAIRHTDIHNTV
jgi:hypothetical protein